MVKVNSAYNGWMIPDSFKSYGKTDGQLRIEDGILIARITIASDTAPEIPVLQAAEDAGWTYQETLMGVTGQHTIYEFRLDKEENAQALQSIIWFFDTLYG